VVNVQPGILPNPGSNSPICAGNNLNLTSAGGGSSYQWSGPNGFTSNQQNPSIANAQPVNSGVYNVTVTAPNGCTASANVNVVVNATPNPVPNSNSPICAGNALNLNVTAAQSYTWSGPNGFSSNLQNPVINNAQPVNSGNYTIVAAAPGGCTKSAVLAVVVNTNPIVNPVNNGPLCSGIPLNINVNSSTTYTSYQWSGPNGFSSTTSSNTIANPNQNNSGNYTITITNAQGCASTQVMAVTVYSLPVPVAVGATACVGQNTQLSASGGVGYQWTGPNGYSSTQQNPSFTNVQTNLSGIYTVVVTSPNNCTASTTANLNIITLPVPTASTSAVCQNQVLNLNSGGGTTYQWIGPNGFTSNQQNPSIPNAQPNMSGTYTVIVTAASSCSAQTTVNATVNPLPTVNPSNNGPVCAGVALNLNVNTASSYTWSGPNGFSSNLQNPVISNPNVGNSGTYTISVTNNFGCVNSAVTNVSIHPLPIPSAIGATACVGQNTQLSASGGVSYAWMGPNGFTSNQQNPFFSNAQANMSGIYTVVVTSVDNCTASTSANLNVVPLPVPTATANAPICQNQNLQLGASGGSSYQWSGPNGFTSNLQNPFVNNAQPIASGTYTVIVTAASSCSNQTTVNVVVNPLPNVTASNSGSVCELGQISLNANGALTYTWSGPGNFSSNSSSPTFTMALTSNSGTYLVIGTDANGCQNSAQTVVDVQPNPVVIVSGATVCSGNTATMGIQTSTLTSTIQWNGPNGFSSNAQTISINAGSNSIGVYSVLVTGVNGCTSSAQANLATYPNPTIMASFVSPSVCLGGTVYAMGDGGYQYAWNGPNGLVISSEKEFQFVANSLDYTGIYTLTIIGAPYGCQNTTLIPLTVFDLPKANLVANDKQCVPFCTSMTLQPAQNSATFNQVLWTINNVIGASGNEAYYCMNAAGQVPVRVQIEDERGCKNIQTFSLVGYPKPVADFYWSPLEPREESEEVSFIDASKGTNLTAWSWTLQTHTGESPYTGNPLVYTYEKAGNYAVMMVVENLWGCKDTIIKAIRVVEDVVYYVPNAFTPNGDGTNDLFGPKGYGKFDFTLSIHDRWGEKLFESRSLNDAWDGTFNGEPCKSDVYVWKMTVILPGGKKEIKTGHVTLLR
jgi:gliding motility-associated-like protein